MRSNPAINADIIAMHNEVDRQFTRLRKQGEEMGVAPHLIRDIDGNFLIVPLLQTKSNLLLAEALMK